MAVVLTRPPQEAAHWAAHLRGHGIESVVLPLLAIGPAPDPDALRDAAAHVQRYAAVMFVSANAVHGFLPIAPGLGLARAWAPGPGTRDALCAAGVPADRIDAPAADAAQFDSEALWLQVRGQLHSGDRLLLVRGGDAEGRSQGRDWLAQQLVASGVQVDTVVAYTRRMPDWSAMQRTQARQAAEGGSLWLFSSSEAARNLARLLPGQDWSRSRALATHPRIAEAVRALGFGDVRESRPALHDVVASIESAR
ncbi:MAG: uroporphyrinogen-III synthase [Comamonadaceae bacterium]|nr:MAG: uroporphyrinogen-III synthase [Comamonadaceae bacterium]